jgi:8-oxo-dGTP diphosphatase
LPKQDLTPSFGGSIAAYSLIINEGKFLLLQRARDGRLAKAGEWELPGGKVNLGESPQAAAARETLEETGLSVQAREPLVITSRLESKVSLTAIVTMVFRATHAPGEISLSPEHKEYKWVTKKEAKSLATVSYLQPAVEAAETQGFL